jgi:5-methylcytosine-specific restriction endonuclease McrA
MPFFVGDFLASTVEWEGEEASLYLLLLGYQWTLKSLPGDPRSLCKLVRWDWETFARFWPKVATKFVQDGDRIFNEQLEELRRNPPPGCSGYGFGEPHIHSRMRAERLAVARELGTHTKEEWQALLIFCEYRCVKCGSHESIEKDHITPLYLGGSDSIENLQPLCQYCNVSKGPDCTDHRNPSWRSIQ